MNNPRQVILSFFLVMSAAAGVSFAAGVDDTRPAEFKQADAQLNVVYRKLMTELRPTERETLKAAQQAWLKFRDADCKWAFSAEHLDCMIDRTLNRTKELQGTLFEAVDGKYREVSK